MNLTNDFREVAAGKDGVSLNSLSPAIEFPMAGDTPVVAVDFDGTLAEYQSGGDIDKIGKPLPHAIWALRTFKFNGWEVEVFTVRGEVGPVWGWVDKYATGLVDRINESRPSSEHKSHKPFVDLFIDDRSEYWIGKVINWIEIMVRLKKRGFLEKGLLPLGKDHEKETKSMIVSSEEPIFREIVSDLRTEVQMAGENREDLIKEVEQYVRHLGLEGPTEDMLVRAKVSGRLLECVLKLMVRDRFDPVGCIILAQQDREIELDTLPPLLEDDFD